MNQPDELDKIIGEYNKKSKGSIIKLEDTANQIVPRVPTGSFSLDIATGGGFPYGSVVEFYGEESTGKSLLALKTIVEAQKQGRKCIYIDLESSISIGWASKLGVDPKLLYIARPKTAEEALDMVDDLAGSGNVGVIVVDSVAALVPVVETENDLEKQQMGTAAKLMSKHLRGLVSTLQPNDLSEKEDYNPCVVIYINQTREKIGVMFGCFPSDTKIKTDKGQLKIKDIVDKDIKCRVLTKNKYNELIYKDIKTKACTGESKEWIKLWTPIFKGCNASSNRLLCTPNHEIYTPKGKLKAKDLIEGDYIYKEYKQVNYNPIYNKLVGMALGDSAIRVSTSGSGLASMRFCHGTKQIDYLKYKKELIKGGKFYTGEDNVTQFESEKNSIFFELRKLRDTGLISDFCFNDINFESLLYWYLDDGTYVLKDKTYKTKSIQLASYRGEKINEKLLGRIQYLLNTSSGYVSDTRITLNVAMSDVLLNKWARTYYVPECMRYKFKKGTYFIKKPSIALLEETILIPLKIFNIEKIIKKDKKYNLTIKGNHNYFANGVLVGNSPLTTPGGKALKFYSSIRVHLTKGDIHRDEKKNIIGLDVKFQTKKNKTHIPFQVGIFKFFYSGEIDNEEAVVQYAIVYGLIEQGGAWFHFEGEKFQGKEKLITYLKSQPKKLSKLKKDLVDLVKKG